MHPNLLNDAPKKDMLNPNKFRNKFFIDAFNKFRNKFFIDACGTIRWKKDNLPALCPFACYCKCDFIDYDVTISPEAKH